jgi:HK97 family phage major capsid protein
MTADLAAKLRQHVAQARAIQDAFEGKAMPAEAAHQMEQHLETAAGLNARIKLDASGERNYLDPAGTIGIGDDAPPIDGKAVRLAPEQKLVDHLGLGRYSDEVCFGWLGHMIKSQVCPVSAEETAAWNRRVGAKDMLSTGGGGNLVPTPIAARVIDLMRANTVVLKMGAKTIPMSSATLKTARLTGDVTASWLAEGATLTVSDATLDSVTLTAQRLEASTKISLELNEDSDPVQAGAVVAQSIAAAMALQVDAAALRGSGTPPVPKGLRNQSGVNVIALGPNGGAAGYGTLLTIQSTLAQANVRGSGFVLHPRTGYAIAGLLDSTNQPLRAPESLAVPLGATQFTTSLPTNIVKGTANNCTEIYGGDWSQLLIGLRSAFALQTLVELYRNEGKIGLVGRLRADVAVEHGAAFAVVADVTN